MHNSPQISSSKSKPKPTIDEFIEKIRTNSESSLIVFVLLFFVIVRFAFGFNGLYGQDAHEYLRFGKALYQFFLTSKNPGDYIWPVNFPLYGALMSLLFRNVNFSLQIISIFSFIGIVLYTSKILKLIFVDDEGKRTLFLLCFLLFSPLVLRASILIMSDVLCMFFIVGAFYHFFKFEKTGSKIDLYLLVFYSFSAVMTRYPASIVLLAPGILALIKLVKEKKIASILLSTCIAGVVLMPHVLIKGNQSTTFINHEFFTDWSVLNFLKSDFITAGGGSEKHKIPNIIYSFYNIIHPGYLFIGIPLLLFFRRKDFRSSEIKLMWMCILLYALFLSGVPYQNLRYVMLTFPLALICLYPTYTSFYNFLAERKLTVSATILILIIQITLFCYVFNMSYRRNLFEREVFYTLDNYPKNTLYTFDVDVSLISYETKHNVINLLTKDIFFKKGELILFNEQLFAPQWGHTNVGSNWSNLTATHQLVQLTALKDGWKLYEIR
jgi:4-amino-4-deoxy-L-arabinose transferase-like glycosyltransferase